MNKKCCCNSSNFLDEFQNSHILQTVLLKSSRQHPALDSCTLKSSRSPTVKNVRLDKMSSFSINPEMMMTTTAWPLVQEGPTSSCLLVFFCLGLLHSEFEQLNSWMRSGQAVLQGLPVVVKEGGGCRAAQTQMCLISNQQLISTLNLTKRNTSPKSLTPTTNEWPQTGVLDVSSAGVINKSEPESRSIYGLKSILMSHNVDPSNCPWSSHFSIYPECFVCVTSSAPADSHTKIGCHSKMAE